MKVVFEITPEVHPNLAGEVLLHTFDPRWRLEEGFLVEAHKQEISVEDEDFLGDIFTVVDNDVLKWRLPTLRLYVFSHWDEADECETMVIEHMDEGWCLFNTDVRDSNIWGWYPDETERGEDGQFHFGVNGPYGPGGIGDPIPTRD